MAKGFKQASNSLNEERSKSPGNIGSINNERAQNTERYYDELLPKSKKKSHKGLIIGIAAAIIACIGFGSAIAIQNLRSGADTSYVNPNPQGYMGATGSLDETSDTSDNSKNNLTLTGEIPCATTWYTSTDFGFSYQIPSTFEADSPEYENGTEFAGYIGEDAEGNDLEIIVTAVTKENGMKNIADTLSSIQSDGINISVSNSDSLLTLEKKIVEYYKDWLKSEHEKLGYIVKLEDTSNGYKFTALLPSEEDNNSYEEQYIINRELYDDGKTSIVDTTDQIHIDSDNEVQDHKWIGIKEIDCGNYIKLICAFTEVYNEEDINPSVSKLKYIINQFN